MIKYFTALGFSEKDTPSLKEVKLRWRELCQRHHPDKGGNKEDFLAVMHAYNMLTDPGYRHRCQLEECKRSNHNMRGDLNIRLQVPVSFEDAFFGRQVVVSYNRLSLDNDFKPKLESHFDVVSEMVDLRPGSVGGIEVLLTGKGHRRNDVYGDALLVITPLPHQKFKVQGGDVYGAEMIPLETLLKGGKIEVVTLYGLKTLRVPPGTKPGSHLKIRDCGVNNQNNHIVQVEALFPSKDDLKSGGWEGLGINWDEAEEEDRQAAEMQELFTRISNGTFTFTVRSV